MNLPVSEPSQEQSCIAGIHSGEVKFTTSLETGVWLISNESCVFSALLGSLPQAIVNALLPVE